MPIAQPAPRRPIAFDVHEGKDTYRVCPRCIRDLMFADSLADPVYELKPDRPTACEECKRPLG